MPHLATRSRAKPSPVPYKHHIRSGYLLRGETIRDLAAQIGDPLVRMGRISDIGIESGIDRRQPQPAWAVAIGLSMGPVRLAKETVSAAKE